MTRPLSRSMMRRKQVKFMGTRIPVEDARALELNARENDRSAAAEMRMAIQFWLKHQGRRA